MSDDATETSDGLELLANNSAPLKPALTVVYHPNANCMGERLVLPPGTTRLGRGGRDFAATVLDDGKMSREHVELDVRGERVILRDLKSRNGSFVNGERVGEARLTSGDVVGWGNVLALFHYARRTLPCVVTPGLVTVSAAMIEVLERVAMVAGQPTAVLVQGDSGVGKELIARAIHQHSARQGDFVAVNCGALAEGVVHSELFGHVAGAFSGAGQARAGLVEAASGGTLFLDEVGDASPTLQVSLLRLLEQGEYRRVGEDRPRRSDARVVAATHVPLEDAVASGVFRHDLYGRVSRFVIDVPPLAERPEDVVPIARAHVARLAGPDRALSPALTLALLRYPWPNNVRELHAVVEQALLESADSDAIGLSRALQQRLTPPATPRAARVARPRPDRQQLEGAFVAAGGNMKALAAQMGVSRATLYRWLSEIGMSVDELRAASKLS